MISTRRGVSLLMVLALGCSMMMATPSYAVTISWTDWTTTNDTTTVDGLVGGIGIHFLGNLSPGFTPPADPPAQTTGGFDYWEFNRNTTYAGGGVDNGPPDSDIIRLTGGGGSSTPTQTLMFDSLVTDPVMAILSMGRVADLVVYEFNAPFSILNQGPGFFDPAGLGSLTRIAGPNGLGGDTLNGLEGHGIIQFKGTFSSISLNIPDGEFWHGFTVGINVPEPASLMLLGAGLAGIGIWRRKAAR